MPLSGSCRPISSTYLEVRSRISTVALRRIIAEAMDPAATLVHAQTFRISGASSATLEARR